MSEAVTAGGRRLAYDDFGRAANRPPLLLIAGRGAPRTYWTRFAEAVAPHLRAITFDNREAGEHDPELAGYTMADLADDAAALLAALAVSRAHVMGVSMGGMVALQLALAYPALVDHLVLVATTAGGWSPRVLESFKEPPSPWVADPAERVRTGYPDLVAPGFFEAHPDVLADLARRYSHNRLTSDGYVRQNLAIGTHDARDRLGEIAAPTLVIHGDRDPLIPYRQGENLAAAIPGARLLTLPGVGHLPPTERPAEVRRAVLDFLGVTSRAVGQLIVDGS
ncbi:MAG TPA: alpha/beta fold hydrolase [Thermomicrobiales bacterium]|nr:alpha/beta fold hydrolase [Thermomicrobiales bacterium]